MRINVYLRHYKTNKGERRYYLVIREYGQKDRHIQLGHISRREAEQKKSTTLVELINGSHKEVSKVKLYFHEFCDRFIKEYAPGNMAPGTINKYRWFLNTAKKAFKGLKLDEIQQYQLERFFSTWDAKGSTKNTMLSILRRVFQKAVDWRYLRESEVSKIKYFRNDSQGSRSLTMNEIARLFEQSKPWIKSIIKVGIYTGLRPKELSLLKFDDIDWENKKIRIYQTKTYKERSIPICPELETELRFLKDWWPNCNSKGKTDFLPRTKEQMTYVFCRADGESCMKFKRSLAHAFKQAGIEGVTPHGLRKTFCTLLARKGVHPRVAQELMRHADIRMTMGIYTEIDNQQIRDAVNALPNLDEIRNCGSIVGKCENVVLKQS